MHAYGRWELPNFVLLILRTNRIARILHGGSSAGTNPLYVYSNMGVVSVYECCVLSTANNFVGFTAALRECRTELGVYVFGQF